MLVQRLALPLRAAIIAVGVSLGAGATADPWHDCLRDVAAQNLAAKTDFQRGMRDLIVSVRPQFEQLAEINMRLQILFAEETQQRIEFLLETDPARLGAAKGLSSFTNFNWSPADAMLLRDQSAAYYDLDREISALEARNNSHPDWPALREFFRAELADSDAFADLLAELQSRQRDIESALGDCQKLK